MANPVPAVYDRDGRYVVSGEAAARLSAQLGHEPQPGEQVPLVLVDDADLEPGYQAEFERWLHTAGAEAYQHAKAHPELAMTADEARARLAAARAERRLCTG